MALGCKADLPHEVEAHDVVERLNRYDTGLIEVSSTDPGKDRMKLSFSYLLRAVQLQRGEGSSSILVAFSIKHL